MTEAAAAVAETTETSTPSAGSDGGATTREARLAALASKFERENADPEDAPEAPANETQAAPKNDNATANDNAAPPVEQKPDYRARLDKIEQITRAREESAREKLAIKRAHQEAEERAAKAEARLRELEEAGAGWGDLRSVMARAKGLAKDESELVQAWYEVNDPTFVAKSQASSVESKVLAELNALKRDLQAKQDAIAQQEALQQVQSQLVGTFRENAQQLPAATWYVERFGQGAFLDACGQLSDIIHAEGEQPTIAGVLLRLEQTAHQLRSAAVPALASPPSPSASPANGTASGRPVPASPTIPNAAASDGASGAPPKLSHDARLKRLKARFG